jgi:hypothetical protein
LEREKVPDKNLVRGEFKLRITEQFGLGGNVWIYLAVVFIVVEFLALGYFNIKGRVV